MLQGVFAVLRFHKYKLLGSKHTYMCQSDFRPSFMRLHNSQETYHFNGHLKKTEI